MHHDINIYATKAAQIRKIVTSEIECKSLKIERSQKVTGKVCIRYHRLIDKTNIWYMLIL